MIKIFFLLFALLFALHPRAYGQDIPKNIKQQAEYVDLVFVDSTNKETLFTKALAWLSSRYTAVGKATKIKNQTEWIIVVKLKTEKYRYRFKGKDTKVGHFTYILSIHCKDTKYKCLINEVQYDSDALPDVLGTDLAEAQPFQSEKYVQEGYLQLWQFLRNNIDRELKENMGALRIFILEKGKSK
jgi:hypothetical protein